MVRARAAELEHDLDQRLPHPGGGLDGGPGGGVHAGQRHRLRRGGPVDAGLDVNRLGQRLSFFFNAHNDFLEEIAKFRAARRLWATLMRDRFGATDPRAHAAALPHPDRPAARSRRSNRTTTSCASPLQALAAVLGGTQSLHCNGRDEALALPTEDAARARAPDPADHRGRDRRGQHRRPARRRLGHRGPDDEIEDGRAGAHRRTSTGPAARSPPSSTAASSARSRTPPTTRSRRSIGASRSSSGSTGSRTDDAGRHRPAAHRSRRRAAPGRGGGPGAANAATRRRTGRRWTPSRRRRAAARNLVPPILAAVEAHATLGEISDALRRTFGEHRDTHS